MTETKLYDKVYGAVMGFAVGDALGVPVEEMHYRNIRKQYGEVRRMLPVAPRLLGGQPHYEQSINHGDTAQLEAGRYADPFGSHDVRPGSYRMTRATCCSAPGLSFITDGGLRLWNLRSF